MILDLPGAKKLLQIPSTDTSQDELIDLLIPSVIAEVASYCKNDFRDKNAPRYDACGAIIYPSGSIYNTFVPVTQTGYVLSAGVLFKGNEITDSNNGFLNAGFFAGMNFVVEGTLSNDRIYSIKNATKVLANKIEVDLPEGSYLNLETASRYVLIVKINFPLDLLLTMKDMLKFNLDKKAGSGINSESLGDHSISYTSTDYPESILRKLNRYRKFKS
jgi:hypothetical protein